jgi:membrane associated rhomboid family serine protease
MAYYDKDYRRRISLGQSGNALVLLIAINLVVFVLLSFVKVIYFLRYEDHEAALSFYDKNVLSWFTLPVDTGKLMNKPWTILTHMFVHDGIWHVLGNMLWLWFFGYIFQDLTGNRKIFPVFLYGALADAFVLILSFNILPGLKPQVPYASALGASAGIMAIAVATTMVAPTYRIFPMLFGGIPLWVLTSLYVIIDLATIPYSNTGGHIAHLAGAFTGFLFMFFYRKGYDWSEWMNRCFDWVNNLFNPDKPKKGKNMKKELFYKSSSMPYKKTPNITQQRVDDILDKINQKGYQYLTEEEKDILKRTSQEDL